MSPVSPPTTTDADVPGGDTTNLQQRAAKLIADNLATGLIHPGTPTHPPTAIPLPMFNTTAMPPQMATALHTSTTLISEAIIHLLTVRNDLRLITAAELQRLHTIDPDAPPPTTIKLECPHGHTILELAPRPHIRLHHSQLAAIAAAAECRH